MSAPGAISDRVRMMASTAFSAASLTSQEIGAYRPPLRSPDSAILPERERIDTRTRDLARNSAWVAGGVRKKLDKVLGGRVRPQFKPDWRALGLDFEQGVEISRQMSAAFNLAAFDPRKSIDAARRLNFGQLARVLYWHYVMDGRCLALPLWLERYGSPFRTAFMLIDPMRLSNPDGKPDSATLRGGIEIDRFGGHMAYHIREEHPGSIFIGDASARMRWERVPARTRWGRPRVIYGFEQRQAEQTAAVSQIVAGLKKIRMLENYDDYELQAAAINALFALAIESEFPSETVFRALTQAPEGDESSVQQLEDYFTFTAELWKRNRYFVDGARVGHLGPGEKMRQIHADRGGTNFVEAQRQWLRYFCNCLPGLSAEELSNDFSQSTYVGIRAGLSAAYYAIAAERQDFADNVMTPMADLIIEEAVDLGMVTIPRGAPSYEEARALWCNIEWVGPTPMPVDPQKEANAARIRQEAGLDTLDDWLNDTGITPEEHLEQLAREEGMRRSLGLPSALRTVGDDRADARPDVEDS